jgi:hypothetical protein
MLTFVAGTRNFAARSRAKRRTTVRDAHHGSQMDEPFIINVAAAALALYA